MAHIVLISAWQRDSESTTISKKEYKAHALLVILGQSLKRRKYFDFDAKVNNYFQEGVQSTCIAANSGSKSKMLILRLNIKVAWLWYRVYVFTDRKDFIDKKKRFLAQKCHCSGWWWWWWMLEYQWQWPLCQSLWWWCWSSGGCSGAWRWCWWCQRQKEEGHGGGGGKNPKRRIEQGRGRAWRWWWDLGLQWLGQRSERWQKGGVQSGLDQEDGDPEESKEGYWSLEGSRDGDCSRGCCGGGGYGRQGSVTTPHRGRTGQSGWQRRNPESSQ